MWSLKELKSELSTTVSVKYLTSVLKSKECCCNRVKRVFIDEIFCPSSGPHCLVSEGAK